MRRLSVNSMLPKYVVGIMMMLVRLVYAEAVATAFQTVDEGLYPLWAGMDVTGRLVGWALTGVQPDKLYTVESC